MAIVRGSKVIFGRPNGEQTTGEVLKVNRTTFKVRTLEERGNGRGSGVGAIWKVHKSLCREAGGPGTPARPTPPSAPQTPSDRLQATLVASALRKLTGPERAALAAHFQRGFYPGNRDGDRFGWDRF